MTAQWRRKNFQSLFFLLISCISQPLLAIEFGVLAFRGEAAAVKRWQPTIDYLNRLIPEATFTLRPLDLTAMREAVANQELDFILTNPGNYVELEADFAISRIATLQSKHPESSVRSAIIVKAGRKDLSRFSQLRDKRLLIVSDKAFGGFQIAWHEMKKQGINPFSDLREIHHTGFPQDQIVNAIIAGHSDVGIVRSCVIESMATAGYVDINDVHVLGYKKYPDSLCKSSTPAYPDWPIAKSAHISDKLAKKVALVLMTLTPEDPAAIAGNYSSWTIPVDYQAVHDLFFDLRIGPYVWKNQTTLSTIWANHKHWLLVSLLGIAWWIWHVIRINKLVTIRTAQLSRANDQLQNEILEREETERKLSQQRQELSHVARQSTAGELARNIAHELNQPLSAITSYVKGCEWRINAGTLSSDEMLEITKKVYQQANRAAAIVESMRNFIRKGENQPVPSRLNPVVKDAVTFFSTEAKKHQIGFSITYTENLPLVNIEPLQLQQVIINLLRNAAEAMIHNQTAPRRIDIITRRGNNKMLVIDIRDYGPGINESVAAHLFEPFHTTKAEGMGIGLSLSQTIIENLGGKIRYHKETTPGARFTVELPAYKEP